MATLEPQKQVQGPRASPPKPPARLRLLQLRLNLRRIQDHHVLVLGALIRERRRYDDKRRRRWWVKPWIHGRSLFGQYHTLMSWRGKQKGTL